MQRFSDNKAGMVGLDKERIQKIIEENTSPDFEGHSKKQSERIKARIAHNTERIRSFTHQQLAKANAEMDDLMDSLEEGRDLSHIAVHVDMDAFYAAVEMRDNPSLRIIPMAVGSNSMLSTSNYAARRFGVRAAMPGFIARKLCPELKIIPCNFQKYRKASHKVRRIFEEYDPNFIMGGLDEAYLDITAYAANRLHPAEHERIRYTGDCICRLPLLKESEFEGTLDSIVKKEEICEKCCKVRISVIDKIEFGTSVEEIVQEMRFRVEQTTGLTCSAGIAPNSMIAKICSDMNKPNGQFLVANDKEAVLTFIRDLPIRKVSGIGAVTEAILKGMGIERCGDLYEKRGLLSLLFSQRSARHFLRIALGISTSYTAFFSTEKERRKSISNERTFHPTRDLAALLEIAKELCHELIESLVRHDIIGGRSATVKMKFSTFDLITRCTTVDFVINDTDSLFKQCERCIRDELREGSKKLRLLGVCLSRLVFVDDAVERKNSLASYFEPKDKRNNLDILEDCEEEAVQETDAVRIERGDAGDEMHSGLPECSKALEGNMMEPTIECPICRAKLPEELSVVNRHIDECLNRQAIVELQKSEAKMEAVKTRKRSHSKPALNKRKNKNSSSHCKSICDYFVRNGL